MEIIFIDTNILIEVTKNNQTIIQRLQQLNTKDNILSILSINVMELLFGARDKIESKKLKSFTEQFEVIQINQATSLLATNLIEQYAKSHHLSIPDALIAANCIQNNGKLWTQNLKDFRYIPKLTLL